MKTQLSLASVLLALTGSFAATAWAASAPHSTHQMVTPADLVWNDLPSLPSGAKLAVIEGPMNEAVPFTVRLKFPANYKIPAHWHPVMERVTVLSGTLYMGIGDWLNVDQSTGLAAGSMMLLQPKTHHYAWTKEETIVQLHGTGPWGITYINPADDPRKNAVQEKPKKSTASEKPRLNRTTPRRNGY